MCFILFFGVFIIHTEAQAQKRKTSKGGSSGSLSKDQWWIGFKGGLNSTSIQATEKFAVLSPINAINPTSIEKEYENISKYGTQVGLIVAYEFVNNFSVSIQPVSLSYKFGYSNEYDWVNFDGVSNRVDLRMNHDHTLRYFEVPLIIRYEYNKAVGGIGKSKPANKYASSGSSGGAFVPFVQLGGFYQRLLDANKTVEIRGTDTASGGTSELETTSITEDIEPLLIQTHFGLVGGIGIGYNIGNARFSLEANYKYGLTNITNQKNRFIQNALVTEAFDVFDNMKIRNIEVSLSFLMPLKFITSKVYNPL